MVLIQGMRVKEGRALGTNWDPGGIPVPSDSPQTPHSLAEPRGVISGLSHLRLHSQGSLSPERAFPGSIATSQFSPSHRDLPVFLGNQLHEHQASPSPPTLCGHPTCFLEVVLPRSLGWKHGEGATQPGRAFLGAAAEMLKGSSHSVCQGALFILPVRAPKQSTQTSSSALLPLASLSGQ